MAQRRAAVRLAALTAAAWALASPALACPPAASDGRRVDDADAGIALAWRVDGRDAIPLAEPFGLVVTLCPARAELRAVDATMPAHRHGMNYRPSVERLADGRWQVDGLLWHMAGEWRLQLEVAMDGRTRALHQAVALP